MQAKGKKVAVLLPNHFNYDVYRKFHDCLIGAGAQIFTIGFKENEPLTDSTRKEVITIDVAAENLGPGDYDAIVILDSSTPEEMKASRKNLNLIIQSYEHQKIIGAIDRAVELLVAALGNLMSGRQVTCPSESREDLESVGAVCIDKKAVADKLLITARENKDIEAFCQLLIDTLEMVGGMAA